MDSRGKMPADEKIAWILRSWAAAGITIIATQIWSVSQELEVQKVRIQTNSENVELLLRELVERRRLDDPKSATEQNRPNSKTTE